jgi:mono/diheme cytochrome c family protein
MIVLALFLMQAPDADVARGAKVFAQSCAVGYCHGTAGAANRGPRLAGRGFDRSYVDKVIRDGIPGTAMPGFKTMAAADLTAVITYVFNISGGSPGSAAAAPIFTPSTEPLKFPGPAEAKKGKDLFFDASRGARCGTCHIAEDWGTAVGPNLVAKPPASAADVRNAKASNVRLAVTASGERFPALPVDRKATGVSVYDLTGTPPVLRSFTPAELKLQEGAAWTHSAAIASYKDAELASIVAYLKWLATR